MKILALHGGGEALVDDDAPDLWSRYAWKSDKHGYVLRKAGGKRIYLHHLILPGLPPEPGMERDHINRNKHDNRSENLRWLTRAQSAQNRGPHRRNVVGVRGVTFVPHINHSKPYIAVVRLADKNHYLGYFADAAAAAAVAQSWRAKNMSYSHEGVGA